MTPATLAKAVRLAVVERLDGSYHVAGDSATHTVRFSPHTARLYCECRAASSRAACSHLAAVRFFQERQQKAAS